jgi:hypothetical protein
MEFKQLIIEKFLSYYQKTIFDFSSNTTIILGQNNTGKSKLFDAMNFALYERVYDTQKEQWINDPALIAELVLNNLARKKGINEDCDIVNASVELVIEDGVQLIIVKRIYSYILHNKEYTFKDNKIEITRDDKANPNNNIFFERQDAVQFLSRKFAPSIKDFFLFQGESASKILKLQKGSSFVYAVRDIARLRIFENALLLSKKFSDTAQFRIVKQTNKNKKAQEETDSLKTLISQYEMEAEELSDKRESALKTKQEYEDKRNELEEELQNYAEFEQIFNQKKILEHHKESLQQQSDLAKDFKAEISEDAIFYKVRDKICSFKKFYQELEEKGEVPPSISRSEIERALAAHRCTICNSDLSEGTEGWKFAQGRLPKCDTDKLGKQLRNLNSNCENYAHDIMAIPDRLKQIIEEQKRFEENRRNVVIQLKQLEEQLESINLSNQSDEKKKQELEEKRKSLRNVCQIFENANTEFIRCDERLNGVKSNLKATQDNLKEKLNETMDDIREEDRIAMIVAGKLTEVMEKLNYIVNTTTYNQIEEKANEYYHEMTKNNSAIVGNIKVDIQNSDIYTVDEDGNRIQNINQANRISIQLAIIAGILTIASDQFDIQYPFVTDAPVSNLGGDNKISTINTIINAFEQSIIILKDDAESASSKSDAIRELIKSSTDIGAAYELRVSKADSSTEQYTISEKIK